MADPWQSGTLYQPGDLVRPTGAGDAANGELENPSFEDGATGWTFGGSNGVAIIEQVAPTYDGTWRLRLDDLTPGSDQYKTAENDARIDCTPGQVVIARCYAQCFSDHDETRACISIRWYDAADAFISATYMASDPTLIGGVHQRIFPADPANDGSRGGLIGLAANGVFVPISVQGVAPASAAKFSVRIQGNWLQEGGWYFDAFTLDFGTQEPPNPFLFQAVQAAAGFSGSSEPTWPTVLGNQVVDNEVTWEAVSGNSVTWQASRILVSGAVEPTWPLVVGGAVVDNTISWILDSRRVVDSRVPTDSSVVLLASSKVFAGDDDIIDFSATTNPLDWSTPEDAGYIGFGLQQYGGNPVTALGLYRGNLAAFNSEGCQLWQLDEDPAGITYLDAIPVPCTYPKTVQPVGDDLALLTNLGARSLGLSGAAVNLQGGYFGQQIDPLVVASIAAAELADLEPFALYWAARGQYWLIFDDTAYVLTITAGPNKSLTRSWSRYVFPETITDWTIAGTNLTLRTATDKVWIVDPDVLVDDEQANVTMTVGEDTLTRVRIRGYQSDALNTALGGSGNQVGDVDGTDFAGVTLEGIWVNVNAKTGAYSTVSLVLSDVATPADNVFASIVLQHATLAAADATISTAGLPANNKRWTWEYVDPQPELVEADEVALIEGVGFEGVLQWPFIELGNPGRDKELGAFDLICSGEVAVSVGWDQKKLDYDADSSTYTAEHLVDGDTLPDDPVPYEVTGKSLSMRLRFLANQSWQWLATNMYVKDLT